MALPEIIRKLLESGVHFGHLSKHWNPKMKRFIFGKKKNVYIIDLEKTAEKLEEAKDFLKEMAKKGEKILFVATKKQLRGMVKEFATSCGMPYVVERWIGGMLTNFSTVRRRVNKYLELLDKRDSGKFDRMSKKEVLRLNREIERMEKNYSGVVDLDSLPGCVYIVDPKKEIACAREVSKLSIPIVALIDTDADPDAIDYPIPGNDDSIKSVRSITESLIEAVKEGIEKIGVESTLEQTEEKATEKTGEAEEEVATPSETGEETQVQKETKVNEDSKIDQ